MVWVSKIKDWLEEDKLILLEGWARDGLSLEQIAKNIGINECTIYDWKKKEPKISEALKKGKPTMINYGNSNDQHWVLIMGIYNGVNINNIKYSDFICIENC